MMLAFVQSGLHRVKLKVVCVSAIMINLIFEILPQSSAMVKFMAVSTILPFSLVLVSFYNKFTFECFLILLYCIRVSYESFCMEYSFKKLGLLFKM